MVIDSLKNGNTPLAALDKPLAKDNAEKTNEKKSVSKSKNQDILELSGETGEFQTILSRIASGFYDKPEIIRQTAEKVYNDINS